MFVGAICLGSQVPAVAVSARGTVPPTGRRVPVNALLVAYPALGGLPSEQRSQAAAPQTYSSNRPTSGNSLVCVAPLTSSWQRKHSSGIVSLSFQIALPAVGRQPCRLPVAASCVAVDSGSLV